MKKKIVWLLASLSLVGALLLTSCAPGVDEEADADAYFKGKTVRCVTSSKPGGGTDLRLRLLAPWLSKVLPGNPRVVVSNRPPHVLGKNYVWKSKPDGLTLGYFSSAGHREAFFEGAEFDWQWEYVYSLGIPSHVFCILGELGVTDIRDLMGKEEPMLVITENVASPEEFDIAALERMLWPDLLDLPLVMVNVAERGGSVRLLNLERGIANAAGFSGPWEVIPTLRPGWLEKGYIVPILDVNINAPGTPVDQLRRSSGNSEYPDMSGVPHLYEFLTVEQQEMHYGLVNASSPYGKPFLLAPGTPKEIVQMWRDAFEQLFDTPEFMEDLARLGLEGQPIPGEEMEVMGKAGYELMQKWEPEYTRIGLEFYERYVTE
ncbi:hypothetical protein ACFLWS_08405 [Chloroflexota bacterium]